MASKLDVRNAKGGRVLVVEDEIVIAMWIERLLLGSGYTVIGPVGRLDRAMAMASTEELDAALLDVNLRGTTVFQVADVLASRDIPFAFLTGYARETLPPRFATERLVSKPIQQHELLSAVESVLNR